MRLRADTCPHRLTTHATNGGVNGRHEILVGQVALVPDGVDIPIQEILRVASASQKQVTRDFAPVWNVRATVDGFAGLEEVPLGYWPVIIVNDFQDAAGFHTDKNGQPFSLVEMGSSWSLLRSGQEGRCPVQLQRQDLGAA